MTHHLERVVQFSAVEPADEDRSETAPPSPSSGSECDWSAVQDAAVAAAEAVAAAAAAEVAFEAASTSQAAVAAASAAAAKAARRAREVAAAAAEVLAAAALLQRGSSGAAPAAGTKTPTHAGSSSADGLSGADSTAADATAAQAAEAERVAQKVVLVASATATAAVDAAVVVAAQLRKDAEVVAGHIACDPDEDLAHPPSRATRPRATEVGLGGTTADPAVPATSAQSDATTISEVAIAGVSTTTIAAALNARGSRTASRRRWTAGPVARVLQVHPLTAGPPAVDGFDGSGRAAQVSVPVQASGASAAQSPDAARQTGGLGSWSWTIATDEVTWSERMYRLFGVDETTFDATYDAFLSCVHPDDREFVSASVASAFAGALTCEFDYRVCHGNGAEFWLHTEGAAMLDDDGTAVSLHGTVSDITAARVAELREQQQAKDLARLAWYDSLTGLGNRGLLRERLAHALLRHGKTLRVLLLDLDDFKAVNVMVGHAAADLLLTDVATRLLHNARGGDTVARLGGDEFAIVMEDGDPDELAARLLVALAAPVVVGDRTMTLGASIGIAAPTGLLGVDDLLVQAEVAMFAAKAAGKGTVVHFQAAMSDAVRRRTDLLEGLRQAVSNGEIAVRYQPIVNVATQVASRVEALVRWQRPSGLILPLEFLPLAEETGLIVGIGQEVLRQACVQVRPWLAGDPARSVAVNVSPLQLLAADYADCALDTILAAHVDPHQVILEVTESLFLRATPSLIEQLERLRASGLRISIDDFGTGYSSLGRLHSLPIDSIKIDKSFVDLILAPNAAQPIISSMIAMARELHLEVTAEGVETAEQAVRLVELGCDHLQGFYFAKPSAVDTATGSDSSPALRAWSALLASSTGSQ